MDSRLIASLRKSTTREIVEDTFSKFDVADLNEKIAYLDKAMYSTQVFYTVGKNTNLAELYEVVLQVFLKGSWKLQEYYERLGFGT